MSTPCPGCRPRKWAVDWPCRNLSRSAPLTRKRPQWLLSTKTAPAVGTWAELAGNSIAGGWGVLTKNFETSRHTARKCCVHFLFVAIGPHCTIILYMNTASCSVQKDCDAAACRLV